VEHNAEIDGSTTRRRNDSEAQRRRTLHPLTELTLTRIREFVREPEVIFWYLSFPSCWPAHSASLSVTQRQNGFGSLSKTMGKGGRGPGCGSAGEIG